MTGLDTNVLIDLLVASQPDHQSARSGLKNLNDRVAVTHTNIGECLRLLTHPRVFAKPMRLTDAVRLLEELFDYYEISIATESERWWLDLTALCEELPDLRGNEVFDARIALCLRYNGVLRIWTKDSDFRKYPFLKVIQRIEGSS